jgi:tetratricopeptide (TPR) repeat protein
MSARLQKFLGALGIAVACITCNAQQVPSRESQRQSALAFEQQGNTVQAEAAWKSLLAAHPGNAEAYAHLGVLDARQEHYPDAIANYRKALRLNPAMPGLRLNLALSLFKSGDLRGAIGEFEPLLKAQPASSPEALRLTTLIGMAHYGVGEYAASIPFLRQAAAGDPQSLPLRMTLAHSCLWSKQYQCVLDVYREILNLNAESAEADMLVGEAYEELKNDAGALAQFQAAVKADPKALDVHFGYGYLLWKALKFDEAEREFRLELANYPEHPLALAYLGDTEMRAKRYEDAVPHLEHATRLQPSIPIAHLDLGIIYETQGRKDDAIREFETAVKLTPDDPLVHWRLGRFYQAAGRRAEAKAEFDKAQGLQQKEEQSLREQLHQSDIKSPGENAGSPTK